MQAHYNPLPLDQNGQLNTGTLKIENGIVDIKPVNGTVWLTLHEIANLFNVFVSKVESNIRSMIKNELLDPSQVTAYHKSSNGNTTTFYNLEVITALTYRIRSFEADAFRKWTNVRLTTSLKILKVPSVDTSVN